MKKMTFLLFSLLGTSLSGAAAAGYVLKIPVSKMVQTGGQPTEGSGGETGTTPEIPRYEPSEGDASLIVPPSVTFSSTGVGGTSKNMAFLMSVGTSGYQTINSIAVTGAGFTLDRNDCPAQFKVGGFCAINLKFNPAKTGPSQGLLKFLDGKGTEHLVTLQGEGMNAIDVADITLGYTGLGTYKEVSGLSTIFVNAFIVRYESKSLEDTTIRLVSGKLPDGLSFGYKGWGLVGYATSSAPSTFELEFSYKGRTLVKEYTLGIPEQNIELDASSFNFPQFSRFKNYAMERDFRIGPKGSTGGLIIQDIELSSPSVKLKENDTSCKGFTLVQAGSCDIKINVTPGASEEVTLTIKTLPEHRSITVPLNFVQESPLYFKNDKSARVEISAEGPSVIDLREFVGLQPSAVFRELTASDITVKLEGAENASGPGYSLSNGVLTVTPSMRESPKGNFDLGHFEWSFNGDKMSSSLHFVLVPTP